MIWGIRDCDHAVVGTSFRPSYTKQGNEDLHAWLLRLLQWGTARELPTEGASYLELRRTFHVERRLPS